MKGETRIINLFLIIIAGLFVFALPILAHPGGTDAYGCHTCYTNCYDWGLSYGEYHCHQSKGLLQPEPPISCEYGIGCDYAPEYEYPSYNYPNYSYPSIPDCPFNSYYDSISDSCKCYSGYIASGGECISADQYCWDLLGYNSRYNILTDSCECDYGYLISGGRCVSGDTYCQNKYGFNSSYDSLTKSCECNYGYVFNDLNQCVSRDDYCQDLYGYNAEYDFLTNKCKCRSGYVFSGNKCVSGDTYCQDNFGLHSSYDSLSKTCECDYGYKLINGECAKPEPAIYGFYPKTVKVGEEVTVSGSNFGDYRGDIILNTLKFGTLGRISSLNIKSWSNTQIRFIVPEDKGPGQYYIRIRPSSTFSSEEVVSEERLEILAPEKDNTFTYLPPQTKNKSTVFQQPAPEQESSPKKQPESKLESKPEPEKKLQQEPESQPELKSTGPEHQEEIGNTQKQEQKKSISAFFASIGNAIKNFFMRLFK